MQKIIVKNVSLQIGKSKLLNNINLALTSGNIYGFRGRNGSGKTVLLKCICGFMKPTEGTIAVNNRQIGKDMDFLPAAGIIIEEPGFFSYYSGYQNLKLLAGIKDIAGDGDIKSAMRMSGLDPDMKKHVGKYSLGMRQRLAIAQAVMEKPEILILDEPTNGLDEDGIQWLRQFLLEQKAEGRLILIASHSREDVDLLCDRVWRMEKGVLTCEVNQDC